MWVRSSRGGAPPSPTACAGGSSRRPRREAEAAAPTRRATFVRHRWSRRTAHRAWIHGRVILPPVGSYSSATAMNGHEDPEDLRLRFDVLTKTKQPRALPLLEPRPRGERPAVQAGGRGVARDRGRSACRARWRGRDPLSRSALGEPPRGPGRLTWGASERDPGSRQRPWPRRWGCGRCSHAGRGGMGVGAP